MMLSICCITYNHGPYIRCAIESFLSQQINFQFEIVISDDCSTDNTREILIEYKEKYPDIIRLILHEENIGVSKNLISTIAACKGNYVAYCEGDDYWTDPFKVVKQITFLEEHPEFYICWTQYEILRGNGILQLEWNNEIFKQHYTEISSDNIFEINRTNTLTAMWRKNALNIELLFQFKHAKDIVVYCDILTKGKGAILNFVSAHYRQHSGGVYSSIDEFQKNYSNFLSLKEIVYKIPGCNTHYLKTKMYWSLDTAIYILCNRKLEVNTYKMIIASHRQVVLLSPIRRKLSGIKELIKQTLRFMLSN